MSAPPHFRRAKRQPMELKVRFRRDAPGSQLEHSGRTTDIGLGGAFVETLRPPEVGTALVLILTAPTAWDPLELRAEVRWVSDGVGDDPAGFGVRFDGLDAAETRALFQLVDANEFAESEPG